MRAVGVPPLVTTLRVVTHSPDAPRPSPTSSFPPPPASCRRGRMFTTAFPRRPIVANRSVHRHRAGGAAEVTVLAGSSDNGHPDRRPMATQVEDLATPRMVAVQRLFSHLRERHSAPLYPCSLRKGLSAEGVSDNTSVNRRGYDCRSCTARSLRTCGEGCRRSGMARHFCGRLCGA